MVAMHGQVLLVMNYREAIFIKDRVKINIERSTSTYNDVSKRIHQAVVENLDK